MKLRRRVIWLLCLLNQANSGRNTLFTIPPNKCTEKLKKLFPTGRQGIVFGNYKLSTILGRYKSVPVSKINFPALAESSIVWAQLDLSTTPPARPWDLQAVIPASKRFKPGEPKKSRQILWIFSIYFHHRSLDVEDGWVSRCLTEAEWWVCIGSKNKAE